MEMLQKDLKQTDHAPNTCKTMVMINSYWKQLLKTYWFTYLYHTNKFRIGYFSIIKKCQCIFVCLVSGHMSAEIEKSIKGSQTFNSHCKICELFLFKFTYWFFIIIYYILLLSCKPFSLHHVLIKF